MPIFLLASDREKKLFIHSESTIRNRRMIFPNETKWKFVMELQAREFVRIGDRAIRWRWRRSLIFVGRASRSPVVYERGINYSSVSVCPFGNLYVSLPFRRIRHSFFLPHLPTISLAYSGNHSPLLFVHPSPPAVSLPPIADNVYNDSSWWDDTGSEVRTAEPDVHSMESSSSTGAVAPRCLIHRSRTSLAREENPRLSTDAFGIRANASHAWATPGENLCVLSISHLWGGSLKVTRKVDGVLSESSGI